MYHINTILLFLTSNNFQQSLLFSGAVPRGEKNGSTSWWVALWQNTVVSGTVKDLCKSLCSAHHWSTVVDTVNWDCDNTSSKKRYIKTKDRCLWWAGLESCVNREQNALLYHFISQKRCYRLIQSNFFDYSHKSFDTNGITKIAFPPRRPRCWIPLRCRKACHHVNHTHGSKSKSCHAADREMHRYSIKKPHAHMMSKCQHHPRAGMLSSQDMDCSDGYEEGSCDA